MHQFLRNAIVWLFMLFFFKSAIAIGAMQATSKAMNIGKLSDNQSLGDVTTSVPSSIPEPIRVPHQNDPLPFPFQFKPETKEEMFARMDTDHDLTLNLNDFMHKDIYYVESMGREFNEIDANCDGKVNKSEFDEYMSRLDEQKRLALLHASNFTFHQHDIDKDGELSLVELVTYINGTLQRNTEKLSEVVQQFDKDYSGKLNLDEFNIFDFNFPWEKFPLNDNAHQHLFFGIGAIPPPIGNDAVAAMPMIIPLIEENQKNAALIL